jgi:EmrB/QacA subfamily drug resistance transporter
MTEHDAAQPRLASSPPLVLLVTAGAAFLALMDLFIVNIAFPAIEASFGHRSVGAISWVLNGYTIVFAAALMPAGRIADRVGRRRVFVTGLVIFTVGSAACAGAWSVAALIAFRVLQASGAAMLMATSLALLLHAFPPAKRAVAIGVWSAVGGIAAASGAPAGGLLVALSWRWIFLVNLPIGLAAAVAALRVVPESRDESEDRWPDIFGVSLLAIGAGCVTWAFVEVPAHGWGSTVTVAGLIVGVSALALAAGRAAHTPAGRVPVVDLALFRARAFSFAAATGLVFMASFGAVLLGNILFLTGVWHLSALQAGLCVAPGPLSAAVLSVPAGRLGQRFGAGHLVVLGTSVFTLGCIWWRWRLSAHPDFAGAYLPGQLLVGVGVGLCLANLSAAAASTLPPARLAVGTAVLNTTRQVGTALGVALLIAVMGAQNPHTFSPFQAAWTLMALAAGLSAAIALGIGRAEHPDLAARRRAVVREEAARQPVEEVV